MVNMSPSELIGQKMLGLLDHPCAGRLQATVIAMASLGVYSPPFKGVEIDDHALALCTELIYARGCFPLCTLDDCVSAFDAALEVHAALAKADS